MPDNLFPDEPFTVVPPADRPEPTLWVRRLAVVGRRSADAEPVRLVSFHKGLNIVRVADRPAGETRPVGHSVGKTLLTRLIRYCLGERYYAREEVTQKIVRVYPEGHVLAEVVVRGVGWVVVRPLGDGSRAAAFSGQSDDWRDGLDTSQFRGAYTDFEQALTEVVLGGLPPLRLPDAKRAAEWLDLLGWLSRDQDCNFTHYNVWRSKDAGSGSREHTRHDASLVARWSLGLLDAAETQLRTEHEQLLAEKEDAERRVREETEASRATRHLLATRFPDLSRDEDDGLFSRTATEQARKTIRQLEGLLTELEEGTQVLALRGQVKELRTRQREADQRLAEIKGNILARESQQETERAAGVGDAYAVKCLCPDKPAACPRAGGNGRGPSSMIRSEVIDRLEGELASLRTQRDAAASDLEQVTGQLTAAEGPLEAAAQAQRRNVRAAGERLGRWRAHLEEVQAYAGSRNRLNQAQREAERLEQQIETSLERQRRVREAQRPRLNRLSEVYGHVLTRLLGQPVRGEFELDAWGVRPAPDDALHANGQAMASLSMVLAFDLASLTAAVVGATPLPAFLIHDSPKSSDLEAVLYDRVYEPVLELLQAFSGREPSFQYIITTTTPPPPRVSCEQYVCLTLDALSPEGRLLRAEF